MNSILLLISLFLNYNSEIRIVNHSKNDQEIKIFRDDKLIHHHIMKDGDWLTLYKFGSKLKIHYRPLTNNCVETPYKFKNFVPVTHLNNSDWVEFVIRGFPQSGIIDQYTIPSIKCPCERA